MDDIQGDKPVSLKARIIGVSAVIAAVAALVTGVTVQAHAAQVTVDAQKALAASAPAYEGAITLGGNLDDLTVKSVEAKQAYDAEQARIAAEQAAQAAAAAAAAQAAADAAAQAAAQAAADEAARQAAAQQEQSTSDDTSSDSGVSPGSGSTSSGAASGTPLPMAQVTDPNNGQYGEMVPAVDPGSWCASHSASTINGVPTCD